MYAIPHAFRISSRLARGHVFRLEHIFESSTGQPAARADLPVGLHSGFRINSHIGLCGGLVEFSIGMLACTWAFCCGLSAYSSVSAAIVSEFWTVEPARNRKNNCCEVIQTDARKALWLRHGFKIALQGVRVVEETTTTTRMPRALAAGTSQDANIIFAKLVMRKGCGFK